MRRALLCLLILVATSLLTTARARAEGGAFEPTNVYTIQQARERIAAGDMAGAIVIMETYVNSHIGDPETIEFLGDLYYRTGQLARAEATYKHVLELRPKDRGAHDRLGAVYAAENRIDDAITQFQLSLPAISAVDSLVALHERKGDLDAYRARVEQEVLNEPNNGDDQTELGQIYAALYQPLKAIGRYEAALNDNPTLIPAINGLGLAYLALNDNVQGAEQFEACLKIEPDEYACRNNLAAAYMSMQNDNRAEPILESAYRLAPEQPEAMVNMGYIADDRGLWKTAIADYAKAIAVGPYSRSGYFDLAVEYEAHQFYPLAQAALSKGLAMYPNDGRMHYLLGRTYQDQGELKLAQAQYKIAAASLDPEISKLAQSALVAQAKP